MFQRAERDLWQTEDFLVKPEAYLTLFTCKLTMNQSNLLEYCKAAQVYSSCLMFLICQNYLNFEFNFWYRPKSLTVGYSLVGNIA